MIRMMKRKARRLASIIAVDHPADREPGIVPRERERGVEMVAADIVEIDVDAVGRRGGEPLEDRAGLVVDHLVGAERADEVAFLRRRRPSRSTVMPLALAICTTTDPTAPAAAETNTMSPALRPRGVEQAEISGRAGHAEDAEEALAAATPRSGSLLAVRARDHRLVAPAGHVLDEVAGREAVGACFRPPRRSRRRPSARRAGTAGRSFSRRSSGRACRGRPTASGCGRGPCRRRAAAASISFSSKLSGVGMPLRAALEMPGAGHRRLLLPARIGAAAQHKKGPAVKGTAPPGLVSLRSTRRLSSLPRLAVGALEAAIEHARAHFALVLALEQARGCGSRRASAASPARPSSRGSRDRPRRGRCPSSSANGARRRFPGRTW